VNFQFSSILNALRLRAHRQKSPRACYSRAALPTRLSSNSDSPSSTRAATSLNLWGSFGLLAVITVLMTWPQSLYLSSKIAAHADPYFSIWRLAWITHALGNQPLRSLFDANIFYPELRTLAYSDATLLEGLVAAPFLGLRVQPVLVYNVLLLGGIFLSAAAMFLLCLRLTRNLGAALIGGVIFGFAPYRIEHYEHLELQWTMWMPLALLFLHESIDTSSWRAAMGCGISLSLQCLSSVYYGIFLGIFVALIAASELIRRKFNGRMVARLIGAAAIAVVISGPYAMPYRENARTLGSRDVNEIREYSARLSSYVAAPARNWLYGWTADRFGSTEARLFPGATALALILAALMSWHRRRVWGYAAAGLVCLLLSLGLNGTLYPLLVRFVPMFSGLRAPARFGVLTLCAVSVVAAFGTESITARLTSTRAKHTSVTLGLALILVEYSSVPMFLTEVPTALPPIYRLLRSLPPGVVMELPVPTLDQLPGNDPRYAYWSITHWRPLINGYSGYYPSSYLTTLDLMTQFPNPDVIARLKRLQVRYLLLHSHLYPTREKYKADLSVLEKRPDIAVQGTMNDWLTEATLLELKATP
jgi:hypothetical protein